MRDILSDAEKQAANEGRNPDVLNGKLDAPKLPRRFYKSVGIADHEDGASITLDEKPIRTPGKRLLKLPNREAARLAAGEWEAQETEINPLKMPVTRIANTAIDGVADEAQAVFEDILKYASSDLLCYRAESPQGLVDKQCRFWDPLLDWADQELGARFETGTGITHVAQPKDALVAYEQRLKLYDAPFNLACLHTMTSLSGSAIIALALAEDVLAAEDAWKAAHVEEDWNISLWGEDFEAAKMRQQKSEEFFAADRLLKALTG